MTDLSTLEADLVLGLSALEFKSYKKRGSAHFPIRYGTYVPSFFRRSAGKLKMEEAPSSRWWFQEKSLVLSTAAAPTVRLYGGDGVRTPGASRRLQGASA